MSIKYQEGDDVEMIIKTTKESQTGFFSNQRLLLIKSGIVSYFSSIPKEFIGSYRAIELSGQIPKFSIPADQISKVQLNNNELSFLIHKSKLIPREDLQKLVKGDRELVEYKASKKIDPDNNTYQQWIFRCEKYENLLEFYRLVNLFRTGDPKFRPRLSTVIEGLQHKKSPRKKTIDPIQSAKSIHQMARNRMSEVPKHTDHFQMHQKKEPVIIPVIIPIPIKEQPKPQPPIDPEIIEKQEQEQKQRIYQVIGKLAIQNQPYMETIDEKSNQDKISELSKALLGQKLNIEIIKTFEPDQKQQTKSVKQENEISPNDIPQNLCPILQTKKSELQKSVQNSPENLRKSVSQKEEMSLNSPFNDLESRTSFEIKQRKKKKINQLLKASSLNLNYDQEAIAKQLKMTLEELQAFIRINSIQEDSCWNFIQNELGKILNESSQTEKSQPTSQISPFDDNLIENYHKMQLLSKQQELQQMLKEQISLQDYENQDKEEKEILKWTEHKINQLNPTPFSSKIISKFQYKIAIRPISFAQEEVIHSKTCWIINQGGHLQQFLAYLNLERTIKEIQAKEKNSIDIECGDAIYLKFKDYEAIVKQLKVGYSYYPLKSIRALQFISKSKDILRFQQDFPQFMISVEVIKQGQNYRFHLDRINCPIYRMSPIKHELKRLIYPFDNELDNFFQSQDYLELQKKCIRAISQTQKITKRITEEMIYQILSKIDNNLEVNIICKLLGVRIDKQNLIYFQPTALRLGNRQFGQELSLIRKARKRGQIEFSRDLSKKVLSKLRFYKLVTPVSNFIQLYLQLIDLTIIQKGELHRAVPVLLKVVTFLSQYEIQQYPVYLSLMKTYLKLNEINNFIKILQNCRLFLDQMFKEKAIVFDFPFVRILIILAVKEEPTKGLRIAENLINRIKSSTAIDQQIKLKYLSKSVWDLCNIFLLMNQSSKAYQKCQEQLLLIEESESSSQNYWIEGVLCLGKSWCEIKQANVKNSAMLQKRVERAIQLSLSRQNFEMTFLLLGVGQKILEKCKQMKLPRILSSQPAFEQARIEFNSTREEMLTLIDFKQ